MAARRQKPDTNKTGQVRITAGQWRGRKIPVPTVQGLRPTGDRVRETLFNWLQAYTAGANCLDLFAGSGVLGFEALSRHARRVTFVELDPVALHNIEQSCRLLQIATNKQSGDAGSGSDEPRQKAHLVAGSAMRALDQWAQQDSFAKFDLVFIDPPFQLNCQWAMLDSLVPRLLSDTACVYIEAPLGQPLPLELPAGCEIVREKEAGEVAFRLVKYCKPA